MSVKDNMIETDRLKIFPLSYKQILKYKDYKNELESELELNRSNFKLPLHLRKMIEKKILPQLAGKKEDFIFNTLWIIVDKKENLIVGDFGIKGSPNLLGEIEMGYGTHYPFQNKGYMTEAIKGFLRWTSTISEVKFILAETDKINIASIKVVEKNNFKMFKESKNSQWWRIEIDILKGDANQ
ncbi:MAG: GNAT family N-acetyltransferase [Ignavibacteria bacterium]